MLSSFTTYRTELVFKGLAQPLAYARRPGQQPDFFYVHGLGCAGSDFHNAAPYLEQGLLTLDFPGCGASPLPAGASYDIDDLVALTRQFLHAVSPRPVVIIGHSMGGLIGLLLAERYPEQVCGFINVEGNLAGSDCFFSRHIAAQDMEKFCGRTFKKYTGRLKNHPNPGLRHHADILQHFSDPRAMHAVAPSLVAWSDNGGLLERFFKLPVPRQFIYGSENSALPYLKQIAEAGVPVDEIPYANHFPHQDNPDAFYGRIRNTRYSCGGL